MSPSCCNSGAGHHGDSVSSWSEILLQTVVKFNESAPWLTVGLVTTVVLKQIKLPTITVRRFLTFAGPDPSFLELFSLCFTASLLGLATPLCSCGAIPMAIGLASAGASPAAVVSFLTAAQSAGIDSAAITYGMLGGQTAAYRLAGAVLLSLGAGVAVGRIERPLVPKKDKSAAAGAKSNGDKVKSWPSYCVKMLKSMHSLFDEIWLVLLIGIFISVMVQDRYSASDMAVVGGGGGGEAEAYVPQPASWDVEEDGPYPEPPSPPPHSYIQDGITRATIVVGSLPFQLCEHGVVSFAAALQKSGVSHGTAHAFLLMAPATNIATLGAVLKTTGGSDRLAPFRSAAAISILAFCMSYVLDTLITSESGRNLGQAVETLTLPEWWSTMSVWACRGFIFLSLLSSLGGKEKTKAAEEKAKPAAKRSTGTKKSTAAVAVRRSKRRRTPSKVR